MISRFCKIAPLKKLIISEQDKGPVRFAPDRPPSQSPATPVLSHFSGLLNPKNLYQEFRGIIKFRTENPREGSVHADIAVSRFYQTKTRFKIWYAENKERKIFLKKC